MKKWIIGVDIGGTKIAVSLGSRSGKILGRKVFSSLDGKKVEKSVDQIAESIFGLLVEHRLEKQQIAGLGVGVPGVIHPKTQILEKSPNLPSWEGVALGRVLKQKIKLPIVVENDANAAAMGEQFFGAGKGINNFVYITISTGIGSGIVANGALIRGGSGSAGEIGHMTIVRDGLPCSCGKRGCLEAYSSGTAIAAYVKRAIRNGVKSSVFKNVKLTDITGKMVTEAAEQNDRLAIKARTVAADYFGIALANLMNLLNPQKIILGGGVMERSSHFWKPMMAVARRETWPMAFQSCRIVRSQLGGRVGDLGAMALVLENQRP